MQHVSAYVNIFVLMFMFMCPDMYSISNSLITTKEIQSLSADLEVTKWVMIMTMA